MYAHWKLFSMNWHWWHKESPMNQIRTIIRKELQGYFSSPLPLLFLGVFLAVELFNFFTLQTFFARGIADIRPMFENLPLLLIALLAALTMRQWSEEQRSGTLEILLTLPIDLVRLVLGKFLAVVGMILLALVLTLPLPITVSLLGPLDWGPVFGGYLAAVFMAGAYAAIGLFISSRTNNQIVALISTIILGGMFYLVGTRGITDFIGGGLSQLLWSIGTGSRFESIQRGVIDLRDLVYYLSLTGIFLTLNVLSLDSMRWSAGQRDYQRKVFTTTVLVTLNLIMVNVWLNPLGRLRLDLTDQKEFTLSQTSKDLLSNLEEPLLIRAYISDKNHPLLKPLEPHIRDMLKEYELASRGKTIAEVVDPITDPEIEAEANQTYGIRPSPFQVSGKYETSVINSYFDILVRYGDQTVTLGVQDLIEVSQSPDQFNVRLQNLEYDLTAAVKKVVFGFQSVNAVLSSLDQPVQLTLYASQDVLPADLLPIQDTIIAIAAEIEQSSNGKLIFNIVNLDDPISLISPQALYDQYGLQPYALDFFGQETFYFHLVLVNGEQVEPIYPSSNMAEGEIRMAIEAALKRTTPGFLKVVGFWTPPATPTQDMFGQMQQPISSYNLVQQQLGQDYTSRQVDLSGGVVPSDIDTLIVVAPENLSEREAYAIDQYLMRGGSVIVAFSHFKIVPDQMNGFIALQPVETGLQELLEHFGVSVETGLVMDAQNYPFPMMVNRTVGNITVQEVQALDYPFFVDIYPDGMNTEHPSLHSQPTVTLQWTSPLSVTQSLTGLTSEVLLYSSGNAWIKPDSDILPNYELYPETGFLSGNNFEQYPLAVAVQGTFESFFKGKPPPLNAEEPSGDAETVADDPATSVVSIAPVIEQSAGTARLVVVGGAAFLDDLVLQLSSRISQDRLLNNLLFVQNLVDWSLEDLDLLNIRSRGTYTRVLRPLETRQQTRWEVANYIIALMIPLVIYLFWRQQRLNEAPLELLPKHEIAAQFAQHNPEKSDTLEVEHE
jgi:ABC-2 type transport system permease protein